jgi:hypothetical protein
MITHVQLIGHPGGQRDAMITRLGERDQVG